MFTISLSNAVKCDLYLFLVYSKLLLTAEKGFSSFFSEEIRMAIKTLAAFEIVELCDKDVSKSAYLDISAGFSKNSPIGMTR